VFVLAARVGPEDSAARGATDAELEALLRTAVAHKELKHTINDRRFTRASRTMSRIGG